MAIFRWGREMTEQELYNEYRKSDCKSFTDFLINKISELNKKLSDAETDYDKMFWQKNEIISNAKEIICEYVRLANIEKEDTVAIWQLYHKAEQFLNSEVEK
jgi:ribonucleotide reductase beta subunit family protein with ferritin-like domain